QIRSHLPSEITVLIRVNRSELSSFKDYDRVNQIYLKPDYPKHHPNTVNANYSVTMNAKYEVLQMAMDLGHVNTKYIAWLDIGCLRNMLEEKRRPKNNTFTLEVPLDLEDGKVAFTEVGDRDALKNLSPWEYIQQNQVWVAGSYFIAKKSVMLKFIKSYQKAVQVLLKDNMASTDQQVIGSMYSPQMIKEQEVEIQTYRCSNGQFGLYSSDIQYFCLPYVCKEAAELRRANQTLQLA
ncbi:Protein HtrL, partial [Biomphalaria pfeifferi]